ncbi:hypothetical protein METBIDRAFT_32906 [Metschnikowia bicuspidata var. bicuspidata NRRL YB-4993]|uniref:Uncharacterized protein n=1 Tax=Metschnikowia bicuspidata var. bicuspidata NRRL YB-4993 TaxID=869754 RepID=A0A1A0H7I0_9ASCO|nr:hypothetical protein METBIDRAFT_32906 [Metschnikowia bicuspidata var. bicuspidata NRRL YB-4993]OBA19858.1 hypothetical protein METBIDRAFT_32906 [Metschnikowia bicuspidata var. bicuspidata NRRL YB-4993]
MGTETAKAHSAQLSKREKLRHFFLYRFKFPNEVFRRRSRRFFRKDFTDDGIDKPGAPIDPAQFQRSNESGGYRIIATTSNNDSPKRKCASKSAINGFRENYPAVQEDKLTAQSLADTSENRSLLKKIRLRWLQNPDFAPVVHPESGTRKLVPQSISFLKEMCPGPSTTEVSCSYR